MKHLMNRTFTLLIAILLVIQAGTLAWAGDDVTSDDPQPVETMQEQETGDQEDPKDEGRMNEPAESDESDEHVQDSGEDTDDEDADDIDDVTGKDQGETEEDNESVSTSDPGETDDPQNNTPEEDSGESYWIDTVDVETANENGKTDMTDVIQSALDEKGYCRLRPGIYYVRGNIDMPYGSTLEGCGKKTIIRLLSDSSCNYIVKPVGKSTIRNLTLSGGYNAPDLSSSETGSRCGLYYIANADGKEESRPAVSSCTIDNLWIENFDGSGIYCHNTGGRISASLTVNNCNIEQCKAGINIDYYSEYHKISGTKIYRCYYACINNGGNNTFTSCTFQGKVGFLIDNSDGKRRNNGHGSAVGCTFNHIEDCNDPQASGSGNAVAIKNSSHGYIFTGCQIWYGRIMVDDSAGVAFSDCLIGGHTPKISVSGSNEVRFNDCTFYSQPDLRVNCAARMINCFCVSTGKNVVNPVKHSYKFSGITKASFSEAGTIKKKCTGCGGSIKTTIPKLTAKLASEAFTYNGQARTPAVTVKSGTRTLAENTDYTVTYSSGRKNVGTYKVIVKMKGSKYSGSKTLSFRINPKGTTLLAPVAASKAIKVKWNKQLTKMETSGISGYQIQLATDKAFTKNKTLVTVEGRNIVSKKVTGLRGGRKYYIRIRTYKTLKSKNYYSAWSAKKFIATK